MAGVGIQFGCCGKGGGVRGGGRVDEEGGEDIFWEYIQNFLIHSLE